MPPLFLTFHLLQPAHLKHYSFFDIGNSASYEDESKTAEAMNQFASECVLPATRIVLKKIKEYGGDFRIALSISGCLIDQFERYRPEVLDTFKALSDTGYVEFLAAPYYHSLACAFSIQEFREQALLHHARIQALTGTAPTTFRNTALIYRDELASEVETLGYQVMLIPGGDRFPGKRNVCGVFRTTHGSTLKLLANHDSLSEDMARRFTHSDSPETPPTSTGFARWIHQAHPARGGIIPLSLDLGAFTRLYPDDTGLFLFLNQLPETVLLHKEGTFITPAKAASPRSAPSLSSKEFITGENPGRDLSPWMGNEMQQDALNALYLLESRVKGCHDQTLLKTWRLLQVSDYFLYMNTRSEAFPGPAHPAIPCDSPYDAYINYMNILTDFSERIPG
ncbi:MAG: alpha-amylase [bacterium]